MTFRRLWTFPTKTMWRMRRFAGGSRTQLDCMMVSFPWWSPKLTWPQLKILWYDEDNSAGHSEKSKKERKIEEDIGRQAVMRFGDSLRTGQDKGRWKNIIATSSVVPPDDRQRKRILIRWGEMRRDGMTSTILEHQLFQISSYTISVIVRFIFCFYCFQTFYKSKTNIYT